MTTHANKEKGTLLKGRMIIPGRKRRFFTCLILILGLISSVLGHDIWLQPNQFSLNQGALVTVRQLAGTELEIEAEIELLRRMTPRFELITPGGTVDLMAELPSFRNQPFIKPVLERPVEEKGLNLLVMDHAFIHTEFSAQKFLEYLEHEEFPMEAFEGLIGRRETERERYARSLKCLIKVGGEADGAVYQRVVGQKLEIVLLENPYELDPGDRLEVRISFDGKPLAGKLVMAFNGDGTHRTSTLKSTTDSQGVTQFKLERAGLWLIRLVHLIPSSVDYSDWESYWASYTFELD